MMQFGSATFTIKQTLNLYINVYTMYMRNHRNQQVALWDIQKCHEQPITVVK